ncbi:MAG: DUF2934 domain-containing protein [Acidisphaera sp.]|nr:DUF2934 domain-containing protein [Acidisphaera sp.]
MDDIEELIRQRAYEIWESEGRPHGRDQAHWERARREIGEAAGQNPVEAPVPGIGQPGPLPGIEDEGAAAAPTRKRRSDAAAPAAAADIMPRARKRGGREG